MILFNFWHIIASAWSNGQSSHLWISQRAIELLPPGDLRDILEDPRFETQWRNGTMFPDGGYAIGDDYGEMAHWEPFQQAYLDWIRDHYSPPWSTEAKEHIAFLMGLGSHGLADQSFDSMYFRRAYIYDVNGMWTESFDTATDVVFVSETGVQTTVEPWVPYEVLLPIFEQQGHSVSESVVSQGQNRLNVAVFWVGTASEQIDLVMEFRDQFPWGTENQFNSEFPGNPPMESEIVAEYWKVLWRRLHGLPVDSPLLFTHPQTGSFGHPRDHLDIESGLSMGLSVGIEASLIEPHHIQVETLEGVPHPVLIDVFYGDNSHIINVEPLEDWSEGGYRVILTVDLPLIDGRVMGDLSGGEAVEWTFSTAEQPVSEPETERKQGCQTTSNVQLLWWIGMMGLYWRRR